jgi:hypothetical protein
MMIDKEKKETYKGVEVIGDLFIFLIPLSTSFDLVSFSVEF